MTTILLGFVLLACVITAMSVGVLMGRKPITGSCGGVGAALGEDDYECELCGGDPKKCDSNEDSNSKEIVDSNDDISYDATKK